MKIRTRSAATSRVERTAPAGTIEAVAGSRPATTPGRPTGRRGTSTSDLDAMLGNPESATILLDRGRCIRRFTPAVTALFSLLPGDVGRPIHDLSQNFRDLAFLPDILLVLDGRNASKKEVESSEGRWYVRQTLPYVLQDGTIEGAVITFSNVDADALEESRSYAQAIVDSVREPLLVLDAELCVHSINQPFSALFQVSSVEVLGQTLRDLDKGVWEVPELLALLKVVLKTGNPMEEYEIAYKSNSCGTRALVLSARPLHRGGGRSDLILVAIDDATEHRRLNKLLQENNARLREDERVWQRQCELANSLRVSTAGELAAGLAHELNQPLSSISNLVEACAHHVRTGPINPAEHLELLSNMAAEAMRAAEIVAHLRSFVDKGEPKLERVDLGEVVGRVPHLLVRELEQSRVTLHIDIPPEQMPVDADTIQIEQVVVNLLQNSMDSIREAGDPRRVIELTVRSSGGAAEVSVRDTGTGVSAEAAEQMFGAFFTTKKQGLGMGLALSRTILESHRGRIWMEAPSDGGPGTVVRFSIPLQEGHPQSREHVT